MSERYTDRELIYELGERVTKLEDQTMSWREVERLDVEIANLKERLAALEEHVYGSERPPAPHLPGL